MFNHKVNGLHISAVIPTKEIGGIPFMTLPLSLSNQNTKPGPGLCPYMRSLDLDRNQFINRSILANSYHHEIKIPIHEIYTWNTYNPSDISMQLYTSISSNRINFL